MYSGKMFFSTQNDVGAERFGGYFSHSIDAIIDGGAVTAAAAAMFQINASSSATASSVANPIVQFKSSSPSSPSISSSSSTSVLSSSSSSSSPDSNLSNIFLQWHSWHDLKNWSVCGQWSEVRGRIHDLRGTSLPQLAFLNKNVRTLFFFRLQNAHTPIPPPLLHKTSDTYPFHFSDRTNFEL